MNMIQKPLRILVVGTGMYVTGRGSDTSGTILPALLEGRRLKLVKEIALCATSCESAAFGVRAATDLGIRMHVQCKTTGYPKKGHNEQSSYLYALDRFKPDAVIVSTPDATHEAISIAALEKGAHCLVVKPLAPTATACRRMIYAADRAGLVAQVEFHKRLDESNLLLRDAIRTEEIGTPLYAVVEYSQRKMMPEQLFRNWINQTNIMNYLGVHYIDALLFMTGFKPLTVTAWAQTGHLKSQGIDAYDAIQAAITWDTGTPNASPFVSIINTSWVDSNESSAMSQQSISVTGTKGRIEADQTRRGFRITSDSQGVRDVNPYFTLSRQSEDGWLKFSGYGIESILRFVSDVASVNSGTISLDQLEQSRPTFRQGLISSAILEAVEASLKSNSATKEIIL